MNNAVQSAPANYFLKTFGCFNISISTNVSDHESTKKSILKPVMDDHWKTTLKQLIVNYAFKSEVTLNTYK